MPIEQRKYGRTYFSMGGKGGNSFGCSSALKVGFKSQELNLNLSNGNQGIYVVNLGFVSLLHLSFMYDL